MSSPTQPASCQVSCKFCLFTFHNNWMTDGVLVLHTFCLKADGSFEKSTDVVRATGSVSSRQSQDEVVAGAARPFSQDPT